MVSAFAKVRVGQARMQQITLIHTMASLCHLLQYTTSFTGQLNVPASGDWSFVIPDDAQANDDCTRIYLNGQLLLTGG